MRCCWGPEMGLVWSGAGAVAVAMGVEPALGRAWGGGAGRGVGSARPRPRPELDGVSPPGPGLLLTRCWKGGERGPTRAGSASLIENTGVRDPGIISPLEPGFQQNEDLKLPANAPYDSKTNSCQRAGSVRVWVRVLAGPRPGGQGVRTDGVWVQSSQNASDPVCLSGKISWTFRQGPKGNGPSPAQQPSVRE